MKTITAVCLVISIAFGIADAFARGSGHGSYKSYGGKSHSYSYGRSGDHSVRGYTRKDGTYVPPNHATNPNKTKRDNYSTKGNVNPYTGKSGTVDPDK
jgi:hypothetical protein